MYELLASAVNHPDRINRLWGVFNRRSLTSLSRAGVEVTAAVPRPHAPPVGPYSQFREIPRRDETDSYPVSHPRFWYYLPKSLLYQYSGDSMANSLQEWRLNTTARGDVFHGCHLYPDGYALTQLADSDTTPLTAYAHGTLINEYEQFSRPVQARLETVFLEADCLFCSGQAIQSKLRAIEPRADTRVVPIGADPDRFPTEREPLLRQELGVPSDAVVVLYCGRFSAQKGVPELAEAARGLDDDSLYLVCIGHGGDLESTLRETLGEAGTPRGRVIGDLPPVAVRRWFAVADLFVLPSHAEGRPTVIYEAMASETPAIGTSVGGVPEQIADGETGWVLEAGDVAALGSRLKQAPEAPLDEMGQAARARLESRDWTWDGHARAIVDTHRSLIDDD